VTQGPRGITEAEPHLRAWMIQALDGDAAAYEALLTELSKLLRAYFVRRQAADPEDLVQETLLAIHQKRGAYRRSEPLTPWVFAIARYKLFKHYRAAGRAATATLDEAAAVGDPRNPDEGAVRLDLRRLLSLLPDRQQRLVAAIKLMGFSVSEAARVEGMSDGAAKVAAHRGLQALARRVRDAD
jgi:RNA polymerase sigma-70 factor (ECF subfamily)